VEQALSVDEVCFNDGKEVKRPRGWSVYHAYVGFTTANMRDYFSSCSRGVKQA